MPDTDKIKQEVSNIFDSQDKKEQPAAEKKLQDAWNYWYPLVFGYFYRRINSRADVEELTANTITALITRKDVKNPRGFIWQTAKNQLLKFIREKQKISHIVNVDKDFLENLTVENLDEKVEYSTNYSETTKEVLKCIRRYLKDGDYEILRDSLVDLKNSSEIGSQYNLKPATVRQKIKRSIGKLKQRCVDIWQNLKKVV